MTRVLMSPLDPLGVITMAKAFLAVLARDEDVVRRYCYAGTTVTGSEPSSRDGLTVVYTETEAEFEVDAVRLAQIVSDRLYPALGPFISTATPRTAAYEARWVDQVTSNLIRVLVTFTDEAAARTGVANVERSYDKGAIGSYDKALADLLALALTDGLSQDDVLSVTAGPA